MTRDSETGAETETTAASTLHAGVLTVAMSDLAGILGSIPTRTPPPLPAPAIRHEPWPWANPAAAVLRFLGWTAGELLAEPQKARRFWSFVRILRSCEVLREEREREHRRRELDWWRHMGCPVACPDCGAEATCSCGSVRREDRP